MRELLRIAAINVYDILEEQFDSDLLKGALALDGVLGTNAGARSNNTAHLLHRAAAPWAGSPTLAPRVAGWAVSEALAAAATANGAKVRTGAPSSGSSRPASSSAWSRERRTDPRRDDRVQRRSEDDPAASARRASPRHRIARRVHHQRARTAAKLHLALDGPPSFRGLDEGAFGQRLVIAPSSLHIEHAFDEGKYGACSSAPVMELILPSVHDAALAPAGKHVLSDRAACTLRAEGWLD
jgi:phytoene dehydrogenase-like protein